MYWVLANCITSLKLCQIVYNCSTRYFSRVVSVSIASQEITEIQRLVGNFEFIRRMSGKRILLRSQRNYYYN